MSSDGTESDESFSASPEARPDDPGDETPDDTIDLDLEGDGGVEEFLYETEGDGGLETEAADPDETDIDGGDSSFYDFDGD
ncbi:hypothetical protein O1R50_06695 [Glycomyces luteolus]|uniref:Uncharacterized protein n=1 Tax=Glycomyces luteolus TaxID=2670330 RepID=A0A9X3P5Z0_9ACTN|nr:hypothetical protein [Glycomyces luteolus]MDA1359301.1 hypothetical protein [Glycomyces luteolus]